MDLEEIKYIDAETPHNSFYNKEITIQQIIMLQVQRVASLSATEWHGGYWYTQNMQGSGGHIYPVERYMSATNEAYSNAVDCLADLLAPYFDKKMAKVEEEHNVKVGAAWADFKSAGLDKSEWYNTRVRYSRLLFRELVLFIERTQLLKKTDGLFEVIR